MEEDFLEIDAKIFEAKGIVLKGGLSEIYYKVTSSELKEYKIHKFKSKPVCRSRYIDTGEYCNSKTKSSVGPNFIHYLDSSILIRTVSKCKKAGINLFTAHDCFMVAVEHTEFLKKAYFEAFNETILENEDHPYMVFIKQNIKFIHDDQCKNVHDEQRMHIFDEIKQKKIYYNQIKHSYSMSPYILSS